MFCGACSMMLVKLMLLLMIMIIGPWTCECILNRRENGFCRGPTDTRDRNPLCAKHVPSVWWIGGFIHKEERTETRFQSKIDQENWKDGAYLCLEGIAKSDHPSGTTTELMYVYMKTTREYVPHARPKYTSPEPVMLHSMNTNPPGSLGLSRFCAVIEPET
jgi:hypothetical protein